MTTIRIFTYDCETAPNIGDAWQLWNTNISLNQLRETAYTLCWAGKFHGEKKMYFGSVWDGNIGDAFDLLDEADVTVTFNGDHFDKRVLQKDFALAGLGPPSPYQSVDLLKVARKQFLFPSNKLEHLADRFGVGKKIKNSGHSLWVRVMAGDEKAQREMRRYCEGDVRITEKLYDKLLPWIPNHPNRALYTDSLCVRCPNGVLVKRGFYYTANGKFQTYRCSSCKGYLRDTTRVDGVSMRGM